MFAGALGVSMATATGVSVQVTLELDGGRGRALDQTDLSGSG